MRVLRGQGQDPQPSHWGKTPRLPARDVRGTRAPLALGGVAMSAGLSRGQDPRSPYRGAGTPRWPVGAGGGTPCRRAKLPRQTTGSGDLAQGPPMDGSDAVSSGRNQRPRDETPGSPAGSGFAAPAGQSWGPYRQGRVHHICPPEPGVNPQASPVWVESPTQTKSRIQDLPARCGIASPAGWSGGWDPWLSWWE